VGVLGVIVRTKERMVKAESENKLSGTGGSSDIDDDDEDVRSDDVDV